MEEPEFTRDIFSGGQMTLRKIFKTVEKIFFIDQVRNLLSGVFGRDSEEEDFEQGPGYFTVLAKSMDLAIEAEKTQASQDMGCDLLISPKIPNLKPTMFFQLNPYYEMGRQCAQENIEKIKSLIVSKQKVTQNA